MTPPRVRVARSPLLWVVEGAKESRVLLQPPRFSHRRRAHATQNATQTTVYLLDEILELARQSSEAAQAIADALKKKLEHRSQVVKFKVCVCGVGCVLCLLLPWAWSPTARAIRDVAASLHTHSHIAPARPARTQALRVIKHMCTKGCATFQRCMQRYSASVKCAPRWGRCVGASRRGCCCCCCLLGGAPLCR